MKTLVAALIACLVLPAAAQSTARPRPPGTIPLEEPPAPPPMTESDLVIEPQVTTRTEGDRTIEEHRVGGKLYMMRVTPKHGRPYVLIDNKGDGQFARQDNLDSGVRVPQWVLLEF